MAEFGLDYLKNEVMEGVPLDEISKKDIRWCVAKWNLIMAMTYAHELADEVFQDQEHYYGLLMFELEGRIKALGGEVVSMKSVKIPDPSKHFKTIL